MSGRSKPFAIQVKAGQVLAICRCGRTAKPPFCDGHHAGTQDRPVIEKIERDGTVYLCGCERSQKQPYCDGSHNQKS